MKKALIILAIMACLINGINAEEGYCKVPGTNDYVQVTLNTVPTSNKNGDITDKFVVINSSSRPLVSARVIITAEITTTYGQGDFWNNVTLYDDHVYNIGQFSSKPVEFSLKQYIKIRNINVQVENPSCK